MVIVAQLVEQRIVVPRVAGSSPVIHPNEVYMKLNDVKLHKTMSIIEVDDCEYTHKLSVLGFVSGCRVCPLMDLDGTLLVDIKGCHYAMSQEIAEHINVEETKENGYES